MSSNTAWDSPAFLILVAVVAANLLVASAHFWPGTEAPEPARVPTPAAARPLDPVVPPNVAKRVALHQPTPVCRAWGPFPALEDAETLARRLSLPSEDFEVYHSEVQTDPDYLVTVRAPGTRAAVERVLESLGEQGIDSYILERGLRENVLAAGVFSARERADAQAGRLENLGFEPAVEALTRSRDVYHLLARIPGESRPEVAPLGACSEIAPLDQFL